MTLRIERYAHTRFWALYDGEELVVVTVYKRGAREVLRRLAVQPRAVADAAGAVCLACGQGRVLQPVAGHSRARLVERLTWPGRAPAQKVDP